MAISPWLVSDQISIVVATARLTGIPVTEVDRDQSPERFEWWCRFLEAEALGELVIHWEDPPEEGLGVAFLGQERPSWVIDHRGWFDKQALHDWLLKRNVPEEDIHPDISTYFRDDTAKNGSESARNDAEEIRALEGWGWMIDWVTPYLPSKCRKESGEPNFGQIAEAVSKQAGEVRGLGKDKLQRLVSAAWKARGVKR